MKVLALTNMYPTESDPSFGTFVEEQVEDLRAEGVEVDVLFVNGRASRLNYLWGPWRMWRTLKKKDYDLIHCHYIFSGLIGRLQRGRPVVLTHHGLEVFHIPWVSLIVRLTHRWFDGVIVVSEFQRTFLADPGVHLIPCGVDLERFKPLPGSEARLRLGLPRNSKLVLWAGESWRREKQFHMAQECMTILQKTVPEAELLLLTGKPHGEVPLYMSACDVLLLTSSAEGSPMVVKEAMACNLPVVSTDVGDVRKVTSGVEGCILTGQSAAELAQALVKVLSRGGRTEGRNKMAKFSSKETTRRIREVYRDLVDKKA